MQEEFAAVRQRITEILGKRYGRADEELMASGLIDSLRAVQLALELETTFELEPDSFALSDMKTITAVAQRIVAARVLLPPQPHPLPAGRGGAEPAHSSPLPVGEVARGRNSGH